MKDSIIFFSRVKLPLAWWITFVNWLERKGPMPGPINWMYTGDHISIPSTFAHVLMKFFHYENYDSMHFVLSNEKIEFKCNLTVKTRSFGGVTFKCRSVFKSQFALNMHHILHDSPYVCVRCNQKFSRKKNLINHWQGISLALPRCCLSQLGVKLGF